MTAAWTDPNRLTTEEVYRLLSTPEPAPVIRRRWTILEENFVKTQTEKTEKTYAVGDKVLVSNPPAGDEYAATKGKVATVVDDFPDEYQDFYVCVDVPGVPSPVGRAWLFTPEEVEPAPAAIYEVGARVRVVTSNFSPFVMQGAVGTVTDFVAERPECLFVKVDGDTREAALLASEVAPVPAPLNRVAVALHLVGVGPFDAHYDAGTRESVGVFLPLDRFERLGKPQAITVTVEPAQ